MGDDVLLRRAAPEHLEYVIDRIKEAGVHVETGPDFIRVKGNGALKPLELTTEPYPGFPTDMQAQMCALLTKAEGKSVISETVFPQRFMHVSELKRMGADISLDGCAAVINGVERISGAPVMASDLRASAALVLAGLRADGVTEVNRVYHIDRGYESIDEKLNEIGARIERVKVKGA